MPLRHGCPRKPYHLRCGAWAEAIVCLASIQRPNESIRIAPFRLALDDEGLAADREQMLDAATLREMLAKNF